MIPDIVFLNHDAANFAHIKSYAPDCIEYVRKDWLVTKLQELAGAKWTETLDVGLDEMERELAEGKFQAYVGVIQILVSNGHEYKPDAELEECCELVIAMGLSTGHGESHVELMKEVLNQVGNMRAS